MAEATGEGGLGSEIGDWVLGGETVVFVHFIITEVDFCSFETFYIHFL